MNSILSRARAFWLLASLLVTAGMIVIPGSANAQGSARATNDAFAKASAESGVPAALLEALCYQEGRLSPHGGTPSIVGGYGCMNLVRNRFGDTLGQAAADLKVDEAQVRTDQATNIRGGAAVLRDQARSLASDHRLPADHDHILAHGDVPGPNLANTPNHVDPGPYWLWTYYMGLIEDQGRAPRPGRSQPCISLRPSERGLVVVRRLHKSNKFKKLPARMIQL